MGVDATQKKLSQAKARHENAEATSLFEGCWTARVEILGADDFQIGNFDYSTIILPHHCFWTGGGVHSASMESRWNKSTLLRETHHSMSAVSLQRAKLLTMALLCHLSVQAGVLIRSLPTVAQLKSLRVEICFRFTKETFQVPLHPGEFSGPLPEADLQTGSVIAPRLLGCVDLSAEFKPLLNTA